MRGKKSVVEAGGGGGRYRIYLNEIRCCCRTNPRDFCKSISKQNKTKTIQTVELSAGNNWKWFEIDGVAQAGDKEQMECCFPH